MSRRDTATRLGIAGVSNVSTGELQSKGRAQLADREGKDERLDLRSVDRKLTLWWCRMAPRCRYNHGATRTLPGEDRDRDHRSLLRGKERKRRGCSFAFLKRPFVLQGLHAKAASIRLPRQYGRRRFHLLTWHATFAIRTTVRTSPRSD